MARSPHRLSLPQGMENLRSDYAMTRDNRFRRKRPGVSSTPKTGDQHFRSESAFLQSREYVRDMVMNDAAIGPLVEMAVNQTIQDGFYPDPQTGVDDLNKKLKDDWQVYSEDPEQIDVAGEHDFTSMQINGFRALLVDGDGVAVGTETGALQMFEAHRLRTPTRLNRNIVYGVELDQFRRRQKYWIAKEGVDVRSNYQRAYDFDDFDVRDEHGIRQVFHFYNCRRITQTRGVTALQPVVDISSNLDDTTFAQLVKTQFAAMVIGFLKRDGNFMSDPQLGERKGSILPDGTTQMVEQMAAGMLIRGHAGEEFELKSSNVNTSETLEFLRYLMQLVGLNLGLPLILALLDASRSNMSSARVDLDSARMGFRKNQQEFIRGFHRPIWRWWLLRKCFTDDKWGDLYKKHGATLLKCRWKTPGWKFIDPWKDANSNALLMSTMQSSPRRIVAATGNEFHEILDETVQDRFDMWDKAFTKFDELCTKHPSAKKVLTVRDMVNLDLYKGGQVIDTAEDSNNQASQQQGGKTTAA